MIYSATTNTNFALRFGSVLSVVKIGNLTFSYMHSSQSYEASNTKSVRPWKMGASLLKVLETVSQRAIDNFQSPLKRFTSGRPKIVKCVYPLSEMIICLSKQVNSPPTRQFPSFSIFGHLSRHVAIIKS